MATTGASLGMAARGEAQTEIKTNAEGLVEASRAI